MRLEGKVGIVTGGGNGIGAATARIFSREGAAVVVSDIDEAAAQAVAAEIVGAGGKALAIRHDVSSESGWAEVVARTLEAFGKLDVLVNNAAIQKSTLLTEISLEEWNKVIAVDLTGPFLGARAAIPAMIANGSGSVINMSSGGALVGVGSAHYGSAKGGIRSLSKAIAAEFAHAKIRSNTIIPGLVKTNIAREAFDNPDVNKFLTATMPLGMGTTEDLANAILFFASDESRWITGEELIVAGGSNTIMARPAG